MAAVLELQAEAQGRRDRVTTQPGQQRYRSQLQVCPFLRGHGLHDTQLEHRHPRRNRIAPLSKNTAKASLTMVSPVAPVKRPVARPGKECQGTSFRAERPGARLFDHRQDMPNVLHHDYTSRDTDETSRTFRRSNQSSSTYRYSGDACYQVRQNTPCKTQTMIERPDEHSPG